MGLAAYHMCKYAEAAFYFDQAVKFERISIGENNEYGDDSSVQLSLTEIKRLLADSYRQAHDYDEIEAIVSTFDSR